MVVEMVTRLLVKNIMKLENISFEMSLDLSRMFGVGWLSGKEAIL